VLSGTELLVDVPPMSNHPETLARVVALHARNPGAAEAVVGICES
jgi:hypothetical protein